MVERNSVTKLRILIPDGRHIGTKIVGLLNGKGFPLKVRMNGSLHIESGEKEFPLSFIVQRNSIISELVALGRFPLGFTSSDREANYLAQVTRNPQADLQELLRFNLFNPRVRVSLLVRDNPGDNETYKEVVDLRDQAIVTSYGGLARQFFRRKGMPVLLDRRISGKEEALVSSGYAEGAIVVVDSGRTMRANRLRELAEVMPRGEVQPVLVYNPKLFGGEGNKRLLEEFLDRLQNGDRSRRNLATYGGNHTPVCAEM